MSRILLLLGFFVGLANMQGQIVNEGTLKIQPNILVYFGDDYTNKSGIFTNDGILHVKGNFTNYATVTTASPNNTSITYFNSTDTASQNIFADNGTRITKFHNLTITNNATSGNSLAVEDNVALDEGVNLEITNNLTIADGQKLRLMGEAQLIQTHTGTADITGDGVLLKDQQGAKSSRRYNYWSSPVSSESNGNYRVHNLKDGTTANSWSPNNVGFTPGYDGTSGIPIQLSDYWFWKYTSNATDSYNYENWIALFVSGSQTSDIDMLPGEGYTMKGTDASSSMTEEQNYTFLGKPNDGEYSITIFNGDEYLIGNPYPSALDADEFIKDNAYITDGSGNVIGEGNNFMDGTIYFWHHWSSINHQYVYYGGGYAYYTLSGGMHATLHPHFTHGPEILESQWIIPQQYIPVGQGFVIRAETAAVGGPIIFKNSQRAFSQETPTTSQQLRTRSQQARTNFTDTNGVTARIRLGYEGLTERHRPLLLAFTNGIATDSFDYGYDGQMIDVWGDDLFFTMEDSDRNFPYAIQGVGYFDINTKYPLTLKVATSGMHTVSLDETENFDEPIYILDNEEGYTYDIRENDFSVLLEPGIYENRFELVFQPHAPLEVQNYLNDLVTVFYTDNEIAIKNTENITITNLQVFNSIGQLIYQNNNQGLLSATDVRIPFDFAQAAYILKLKATEGKGTYKFINY